MQIQAQKKGNIRVTSANLQAEEKQNEGYNLLVFVYSSIYENRVQRKIDQVINNAKKTIKRRKQMNWNKFIEKIHEYESNTFSAETEGLTKREARIIARMFLKDWVDANLDGVSIEGALEQLRAVDGTPDMAMRLGISDIDN